MIITQYRCCGSKHLYCVPIMMMITFLFIIGSSQGMGARCVRVLYLFWDFSAASLLLADCWVCVSQMKRWMDIDLQLL